MQTELAKWPEYYGDLEVQVFAPRFYYSLPRKDDYSKKIVYGKRYDYSEYFLREVQQAFSKLPFTPDLIVVVPSSKLNVFSPTMVQLGEKLSRTLNIQSANIIKRVKEGKKLTECSDSDERHAMIDGSFKVTRKLNKEKVVLLDDTRTTGMTFLECAKELKTAGASDVVAVCLGINAS